MNKRFWPTFASYYAAWQDSGNTLLWSTRYFDIFCANDSVIFLWPKRLLESNISIKGNLLGDKHLWPIFSRITEHGRPHPCFYRASKGLLAIISQLKISFLQSLEVNENTTIWKTGHLHSEKQYFGTFHLLQSKMTNVRERFVLFHVVFLQILCKWSFFGT